MLMMATKKVIGNGIPTTYGSLNLALSYKGFDVSVMFRGAFNFQVLNRQRMHWETTSRIGEGNLLAQYWKTIW